MIKIITILFFAVTFAFSGPVSYYGALKASGNKLIGEKTNTPVQVRGMSFFWSCIDWGDGEYAKFWTSATVDAMVDGWKAEIIRAAMAANNESGCGDYQSKKAATLSMVKTVVDRAIERDIYAIIDWHSHKAHEQQAAAINFFVREMKDYHNVPNVIFEIYNEPPDGDANQWATIKPYTQAVIDSIRGAGANNLILVGTPYYDQDPDIATANPVSGADLAYVLHFYAAQHTLYNGITIGSWRIYGDGSKTFRKAANNALEDGYPLFVSEYGTVNADGNGSASATESNKWHSFMDSNKISSCNWAINNKSEGASTFISSFSVPSSGSDAAWTNTSNMTASGKYIYEKLLAYAANAEWRNASTPVSFNPAIGNKIFAVNNGVSLDISGASTMQVFDLQGNLVRAFNLNGGSNFVSLNDLPKKLYIVKVSFGSESKILNVPVR